MSMTLKEVLLWKLVLLKKLNIDTNISKHFDFHFIHDLMVLSFSYFGISSLRNYIRFMHEYLVHFEGLVP